MELERDEEPHCVSHRADEQHLLMDQVKAMMGNEII